MANEQNKRTLKSKLIFLFILVGVVPLVLTALLVSYEGRQAIQRVTDESEKILIKGIENQLLTVRDAKKTELKRYFKIYESQLTNFATNRMTLNALKNFRRGVAQFRAEYRIGSGGLRKRKQSVETFYRDIFEPAFQEKDATNNFSSDAFVNALSRDSICLQAAFISDNPNEMGAKHLMAELTGRRSLYAETHQQNHTIFYDFMKRSHFNDIFFVDSETGNVIYTVSKQIDFMTSLVDGPFANSGLGKVFKQAKSFSSPSQIAYADFAPYEPLLNKPTAFIGAPILDKGTLIGVVIFQLTEKVVNDVMSLPQGLGVSGETLMVGPDYLMRSDSQRALNSHSVVSSFKNPENGKIQSDAIKAAIQMGTSGIGKGVDHLGNEVLEAYMPIQILGQTWALLVKIDVEEAFTSLETMGEVTRKDQKRFLSGLSLTVIIALLFSMLIAVRATKSITRPLEKTATALEAVASGDLSQELEIHESYDELAKIAQAFNTATSQTRNSIAEVEHARVEEVDYNQELEKNTNKLLGVIKTAADGKLQVTLPEFEAGAFVDIAKALDSLFTKFHKSVTQVRDNALLLAKSSQKGEVISEATQTAVAESNQISAEVAETSEVVSMLVQQLSAALSQMSGSIDEVALRTQDAVKIADQAVTKNRETDELFSRLGASSNEISDVVQTITVIAKQTNLLALNATIEAASAGEAGKGFAVVANEVKDLAKQTSRATEDIRQKITTIQQDSTNASNAVKEVAGVISKFSELQTSIAAAIEEQAATISEITSNVNDASSSADEINLKMGEVAGLSAQANESVVLSLEASKELANMADSLTGIVNQFK